MKYKVANKTEHMTTIPFKVESLEFLRNEKPLSHAYYRINCPDWVNILPITIDGKAVLIRQFRAGSLSEVLEVPGGVIDPDEKDPTMAALRELEEETGFTSQRILPLANINPNPAIQNNRCHMFVALGCHINPDRKHFPDEEEDIEIVLTNPSELEMLVRTGQINHGICALTILLGLKYLHIPEGES